MLIRQRIIMGSQAGISELNFMGSTYKDVYGHIRRGGALPSMARPELGRPDRCRNDGETSVIARAAAAIFYLN